jgi:hypothetical protein
VTFVHSLQPRTASRLLSTKDSTEPTFGLADAVIDFLVKLVRGGIDLATSLGLDLLELLLGFGAVFGEFRVGFVGFRLCIIGL